jgi:hypothetical protein
MSEMSVRFLDLQLPIVAKFRVKMLMCFQDWELVPTEMICLAAPSETSMEK